MHIQGKTPAHKKLVRELFLRNGWKFYHEYGSVNVPDFSGLVPRTTSWSVTRAKVTKVTTFVVLLNFGRLRTFSL